MPGLLQMSTQKLLLAELLHAYLVGSVEIHLEVAWGNRKMPDTVNYVKHLLPISVGIDVLAPSHCIKSPCQKSNCRREQPMRHAWQ